MADSMFDVHIFY